MPGRLNAFTPAKFMRHLKLVLSMGLCLVTTVAHGASWQTDLNAGRAQAAKEGKNVLVSFTGSDWCQWCIKLNQEIFSQPEFEAFASKNLVLVEVDFPKRKPQTATIQKANAALLTQYKVEEFPTLIVVNPQGKVVHRRGYLPGGPKPFVQDMIRALGLATEPPPAMVVAARPKPAPEPAQELPLYGGAPAAPPQRYTDLVLKNISGTKKRRFALLNNQTLAAGETARVQLGDSEVKVRCLEIRDQSVVVTVDGQEGSREVFLRK
jgi:thioredoxin-related protein